MSKWSPCTYRTPNESTDLTAMPPPNDAPLAPYAILSDQSGGREHPEPDDPLRSPFELDRHRIIESTAFRRLVGKTQVFVASQHDHFRTRLTHTLEAAEIARSLAVGLAVNEQLSEAITLAHDLGHPPFGHAGEAALNEEMAAHGGRCEKGFTHQRCGFNHNAHSLRVVEYLEHPFPAFRGLNLTAQTLAGLAAHATRYDTPEPGGHGVKGIRTAPSVEAQAASVADRVAYNCHDLEDAIGAGFVSLEDLEEVALWQEALGAAASWMPDVRDQVGRTSDVRIHAIRRVVLDALLDRLLTDLITTSKAQLAGINSPKAARMAPEPLVGFSGEVETKLEQLEKFLHKRLYRRPQVVDTDTEGRRMVRHLFAAYRKEPSALPPRFAARIADQGPERVICDYLAGMTDHFCRNLFKTGVGRSGSGGADQ